MLIPQSAVVRNCGNTFFIMTCLNRTNMIKEVNFKKWNCQTRCSHYPSRVLGRLAQSVEMNNWSHRLTLLFQDHRKRLEAIVTRMTRDKEAAADIVQDVFSKIVDGGSDKSHDENVKILYVATRNASIDHIRTSRRPVQLWN